MRKQPSILQPSKTAVVGENMKKSPDSLSPLDSILGSVGASTLPPSVSAPAPRNPIDLSEFLPTASTSGKAEIMHSTPEPSKPSGISVWPETFKTEANNLTHAAATPTLHPSYNKINLPSPPVSQNPVIRNGYASTTPVKIDPPLNCLLSNKANRKSALDDIVCFPEKVTGKSLNAMSTYPNRNSQVNHVKNDPFGDLLG
ncbi:unnamed protein product [Gongylonema pulchrum]|uniref:WH2 domain-containing protein n=1 Tax=Gongylonema pulchrum TaxID=637853 RepID=A0A183ECI8_9BILA|nr:unnamed protein product [Gongylonema pulchrum]